MPVIDLDSHSQPRTEDYVVKPDYALLKPRVYTNGSGDRRLVFNGKVVTTTLRGIRRLVEERHDNSRRKIAEYDAGKPEWRAANYDGDIRYEQVKAAGIDFQFVSSGSVGMFNYVNPDVGAEFCRAGNNFIYDNFVMRHPDTFSGLPQLPLQDTSEAIKELERCVKDLGMRTFLMPTNWNGIDMADPHWWSFWDKVRALGVRAIIVHIGSLIGPWVGKERLAVLGPDGTNPRRIVSQPFEYCTNILNLIFGGMMENFPDFKVVFLEAGAEFAVMLKHRIEENLEFSDYLASLIGHPLDWYFERLYFVVDNVLLENDGRRLRYVVDELGADRLVLGSDYPHSDGDLDCFGQVKQLSWLPAPAKEAIMGKNAESLIIGSI